MSDPNPRRQAREILEALERYERQDLLRILAHVFTHYVLPDDELQPRPAARRSAGDHSLALRAEDLRTLSFAQVIEQLQLRLELPELQLLEVREGRVFLQHQGQQIPVEPAREQRVEPLPPVRRAPAPATPHAPATVAAPGTRSVEVNPVGHAAAPAGEARAPVRPAAASQAAAQRAAGGGAAPAPAAPAPAKEEPPKIEGGRFAGLEID